MSQPVAEILSQGDEVVTGQVADTNAAWLAEQLTGLGFLVLRHTSVGDRLPDLISLFEQASTRADLVLCSGGLGPTEDDLTAGAVATAFDRPLLLDEVALANLKDRYARSNRPMPEVNRKQAFLPSGSVRLDNHHGTAPGFAVEEGRAWMGFLPGVPGEMKAMFTEVVLPIIRKRFRIEPGRLVTLRTTGTGESNLQEMLDGLPLPEGAMLSFRTKLPENHIKLRFPPEVPLPRLVQTVGLAIARIGRYVFTVEGAPELTAANLDIQGGSLAAVVARQLNAQGQTLAVAESCTGGHVAVECTAQAGSSAWFLEGAVTYSNAAKTRQLGVDPAVIEKHGAVSAEVAIQMAEGLRERSGAHWALATTGIAGPTGASPGKPIGTVHIALASPTRTVQKRFQFSGGRGRIQTLAAAAALDLLRRSL